MLSIRALSVLGNLRIIATIAIDKYKGTQLKYLNHGLSIRKDHEEIKWNGNVKESMFTLDASPYH